MSNLVKARIVNHERVSSYHRLTLEAPELALSTRAGQFFFVRCAEGSNLLLRRPFSLHRIPQPSRVQILYGVVGKGTRALSQARPGGWLDVLGPLGNGFDVHVKADVHLVVAGGMGVAPVPALVEALSKDGSATGRKVAVVAGARSKDQLACLEELRGLGADVHCITDDGSHGTKGLASDMARELLAELAPRSVALYAVGPRAMLAVVAGIAEEKGIPCQVSLEERMACGIGACLSCVCPVWIAAGQDEGAEGMKHIVYKKVCSDGPVFEGRSVAWDRF